MVDHGRHPITGSVFRRFGARYPDRWLGTPRAIARVMFRLPMVDSFEQADICGPCGGECCKSFPGVAMPADFGDTPETMLAALTERLSTGKWAVDWWEGNPTESDEYISSAYFLRPAVVNGRKMFDPTYGGACVFHGPNGCEIFETRPSGCRGLEPAPEAKCVVRHSSKQDAAIAWLPFHDLILQAADLAR